MMTITEQDKVKAFDDGWKAYWAKTDQDKNPFNEGEQNDLYEEWALGWIRAYDADQHEM